MSSQQPAEPAAAPPRKPLKILVVDDEAHMRALMKTLLSRADPEYHIFEAYDGRQALEVARRELPDLILLDIVIPLVSGVSVCEQLKRDPATRNVKIILVTAKGREQMIYAGMEVGADDYITKPFEREDFLARVRQVLSG